MTLQVLDLLIYNIVTSLNNAVPLLSSHLYDGILRFVLSAIILDFAVVQTSRQLVLIRSSTEYLDEECSLESSPKTFRNVHFSIDLIIKIRVR